MQPITITINAATVEAANAIRKFAADTAGGLNEVTKAGHAAEGVFAANKMAIMEMEHSARSMADGLISGINPIRMMAMEGPRLMQASTMMTEEFKAKLMGFLPILGGIGVALAAGAVAWHFYGDALVDPTKRAKELATALEKLPDILKQIETAQRAGSLSPAAAQKYKDMLSGATPLYNVTTIADAFGGHAGTVKNGAMGLFGEEFPQLTFDPTIRNSRTGAVIGQRQRANQTDITKYVEQMMRTDKVTDANDKTNPGDEALAKLNEQELKIRRDAELGKEKEIDRIKDRYELERRNIAETRDLAVAAHKWTADDQAKYDATITASKKAEDASIYEIQQREIDETARKQLEVDRTLAAARKNAWQQLEHQLADDQQAARQTTTDKTKALYLDEYNQKVQLAFSSKVLGIISEQEYQDFVTKAQKERTVGEKEYRAELEKVAATKQEISRADLEAQIKGVQTDPFSTRSEKDAQLMPMYQQLQLLNALRIHDLQTMQAQTTDIAAQLEIEKQITGLKQQQADIGDKMNEAQKTQNPVVAFGTMFSNLRNEAEISFSTLATTFQNVFNTAVSSISHGITGLIEGTMTWGQALRSIANSILNEVISAIVQMGVRWLLTQAIMAIGGRSIMAAAMAASAPIAAAQAMIWTPAAVMATIGTLGAAAVAAPGFIGAAEAMSLGLAAFATGGYTGDGGVFEPAGIVHKGEYVFSQAAVDRIGVPVLDAMHNNAMGGGGSSTGAAVSNKTNLSVYGFTDPDQMMDHFHKSDAHEAYVVDVMARNAHKLK